MDSSATVFVVDDDAAARESVLALVSQKGVRAKGFASAEEFLAQFSPQLTGCLVVDVRMTGMSGLQMLQQLHARQSTLPAIVITGYADVPMAVKAMQSGALTFLEKPCQDQELWQAIQKALDKDTSLQSLRRQKGEIESRLATLTPDEVAVLRKLLEGLPNKRIAVDLDIGLRTVELRRSNIMKKMQAASLPELVRVAILIGFLPAEKTP
jgi:two-component system, LuxR family, response regulator FixJ